MNLFDPSITELDEVYSYYETNKESLVPPLGVQVGWAYRHVEWPENIEEVKESTEFQRLEWARFLPDAEGFEQGDVEQEIFLFGWENMDSLICSHRPLTPKQQLQHDGDYQEVNTETTEGISYEELARLL